MSRILVVEDQLPLLNSLKKGLVEEEFQVLTASTGQEAYGILKREPCDGVILDLMLPDGDGLSLLRRLREEEFVKPAVVVLSSSLSGC
jgi:DNA-binding response OmpR family regulator